MDVIFLEVTEDAKREAARQYGIAIAQRFDEAERLLRSGRVVEAEDVAREATKLRMDARYELVVR